VLYLLVSYSTAILARRLEGGRLGHA
jgi:hypothetical protein